MLDSNFLVLDSTPCCPSGRLVGGLLNAKDIAPRQQLLARLKILRAFSFVMWCWSCSYRVNLVFDFVRQVDELYVDASFAHVLCLGPIVDRHAIC